MFRYESIFSWLDFVMFSQAPAEVPAEPADVSAPAPKKAAAPAAAASPSSTVPLLLKFSAFLQEHVSRTSCHDFFDGASFAVFPLRI